ncbi:hypothetical protein SAMN05216252_10973 [Actinacidiphila glaucinigra]|uniref:Uncharacterized protein n=1 Tax=Actinacidiphila glaucinigra TaxID=235986 RepID=A0A239HSE2_9ACTN|nr:hypothetical protein SAMN05216252_10973 [Actinacidiphila glaucinigra]
MIVRELEAVLLLDTRQLGVRQPWLELIEARLRQAQGSLRAKGRPAVGDHCYTLAPTVARCHRSCARAPSQFPSHSAVFTDIHHGSGRMPSPATNRPRTQVNGPARCPPPANRLGKPVGGNPSRVRISYPPPVPHRARCRRAPPLAVGPFGVLRWYPAGSTARRRSGKPRSSARIRSCACTASASGPSVFPSAAARRLEPLRGNPSGAVGSAPGVAEGPVSVARRRLGPPTSPQNSVVVRHDSCEQRNTFTRVRGQ